MSSWIEHTGNVCPVPGRTLVEVDLGDGAGSSYSPAEQWGWGPGTGPEGEGRIKRYRVLATPPAGLPQGPEAKPTANCWCKPGQCLASEDGKRRGRMSAISDIVCLATVPEGVVRSMPIQAGEDRLDSTLLAAGAPSARYDADCRRLPPSAPSLLQAAAKHMADRAATYDKPGGERSMRQTVTLFNELTGHNVTEAEGWSFMLLLKLVRDHTTANGHPDSQEDAIAYAALMAEARRAVS